MLCISFYLCYYKKQFLEVNKMELTRGVKKYLDELINDDSIFVVLIYGSNATGRTNTSSDLDIFVLGSFESNFRKAIEIDETDLEINFNDIKSFERCIDKSIENNNSYYESILTNNIVLKDSNSLVEKYKNYITMAKSVIKKQDRRMPIRNQHLLQSFYKDFMQYEDLYSYFNFLDEIRMTASYMYNYSSLNVGKVYDMYSDPKHAMGDYCLVMPSIEFISHFDSSIRKPFNKEEMKWLMNCINYDPLSCLSDCGFFNYIDSHRRKSILIHMDKMINKAIQMLVMDNPYKDYVYHVVINHIYRFYEEIHGSVTEEFVGVFNSAKSESDSFLKIQFLKQLFSLLEIKHKFDYKNYTLYFN